MFNRPLSQIGGMTPTFFWKFIRLSEAANDRSRKINSAKFTSYKGLNN